MPNDSPSRPGLLEYSLQVACIAQAVIAVPVALCLGSYTFEGLFNSYYFRLYFFITYLLNALMAAAIVFIIIVQLKIPLAPYKTLVVESTKSVLATVMWLWLILDAAFGPMDRYGYYPDPDPARRRFRTIRAAIMSILLFIIFFPTLVIALYVHSHTETSVAGAEADANADENTPLLSENV